MRTSSKTWKATNSSRVYFNARVASSARFGFRRVEGAMVSLPNHWCNWSNSDRLAKSYSRFHRVTWWTWIISHQAHSLFRLGVFMMDAHSLFGVSCYGEGSPEPMRWLPSLRIVSAGGNCASLASLTLCHSSLSLCHCPLCWLQMCCLCFTLKMR